MCTTDEMSPIGSTVCRRIRSCGLTPTRRSGRAPPGSSSNDRSKSFGGLPDRRRVVLLGLSLHGLGRLLALCAVLLVRGRDRLLLVSPPRAQSSLPSLHRGSTVAVSHEPRASVRREKSRTKERQPWIKRLLLLFRTRSSTLCMCTPHED